MSADFPPQADTIQALSDWKIRLSATLADDIINEPANHIFLPDRAADSALIRLGMSYPRAAEDLRASVARCTQCLGLYRMQKFDPRAGAARLENLSEAMSILDRRLEVVIDELKQRKIIKKQPPQRSGSKRKSVKNNGSGVIQDPLLHNEREGEWLNPPLTLAHIARITAMDKRTVKNFFASTGIHNKTRQNWTVRLDTINPQLAARLRSAASAKK